MKTMHYYKTTLRLGGNTMNEVQKIVSAPEFLVLQFIHGTDALINVEEIKNEKIKMSDEKDRLRKLYEMGLIKREQSIDSIFGALGNLPTRLPAELLERYGIDGDELDLVELTEEGIAITARRGDAVGAKHQPKTQQQLDNEQRVLPAEQVNVADIMG